MQGLSCFFGTGKVFEGQRPLFFRVTTQHNPTPLRFLLAFNIGGKEMKLVPLEKVNNLKHSNFLARKKSLNLFSNSFPIRKDFQIEAHKILRHAAGSGRIDARSRSRERRSPRRKRRSRSRSKGGGGRAVGRRVRKR